MLTDVLAPDEPKATRTTRNQRIILILALAFLIPLALGTYIGYVTYANEPVRNWFWDVEPTGSQVVSYFPEPYHIGDRATMLNQDTFWYWYMDVSYSRTLRSYDNGPIVIGGDDNPFAPGAGQPSIYPFPTYNPAEADTFTFGDLRENLTWWFTDWRPFQWLENTIGLSRNAAAAHSGNSFLTMGDTDCTGTPNPTAVATDPDCWDDTSGAANDGDGSGFLPNTLDAIFMDASSGAGTATMDGALVANTIDTTGFTGTFAISTFQLTLDSGAANTHAGGTITIGISAALGISATNSGVSLTLSGSASIQCGTAACDVTIGGAVNISSATAFIDFGSGNWIVSGTWTNSSTTASWDAGTGLMTFNGTAGTFTFASFAVAEDEFNNVTMASTSCCIQTFTMATNGLRMGGLLTLSSTTGLDTAGLALNTATLTITGSGDVLTAGASTITVTGTWTNGGGSGGFVEGTSTVDFSATGNVPAETFNNLTISGGTRTATGNVTVSGTLTVSGGTYAKVATLLTVTGGLDMTGGDITSTSGNVTVGGNVNISNIASTIDFGSETWTISGTWTNVSTDAAWDAGTGTVLFDDATAGTMTFAPSGLGEDEFSNVTFNSTGGTNQTFTMATNALRWGGTLTIQDAIAETFLATAGLGLTGGGIAIGTNGTLTTTTSTISVNDVDWSGTSGGTITATSGTWTVSGNWDSSITGATYTSGTSTVTFSSTAFINSDGGGFSALIISGGVVTLSSALGALNLTISGGTFAKGLQTLTITQNITLSGGDLTSISGNVTVRQVIISSASSAIDLGSETWTVTEGWTNASTDSAIWDAGTGTVNITGVISPFELTFAPAGLGEDEFNNLTMETSSATPRTWTMITNALRITGTLTVQDLVSGTTAFVTSGLSLTVGALTIGSGGTLNASSSTVSSSGAVNISGTSGIIQTTGTGAWTVSGNWTNASTSGSWTFAAPITFDASGAQSIGGAGTRNIFTGNWTFTGGAKSFTGDLTTASVSSTTAARTLTVTDTVTWTITGGDTVAGATAAVLTIVSSTSGTQWDWTVSGAGQVVITFASITDANATSVTDATTARFDATATNNTDGENNTYVEFNGSPVTTYVNARWYEDLNSYYFATATDGLTSLTRWEVITDLGYYGTTVTAFAAGGNTNATVCSSDATATVAFTIGGLTGLSSYTFLRDSVELVTSSIGDGGVFTFSVAGGWDTACSTNAMVLRNNAGGGGPPPREGPPDGDADFDVTYPLSAVTGKPVDRCDSESRTLIYTDTTVSESIALTYIWDFGDNTGTVVRRTPDIQHSYAEIGTYVVEHVFTFTDGSIFRTSALLEVGFCSVSFLTDFAPNIAIGIIAISALLWISFVATRKPRRLVFAIVATVAGVLSWLVLTNFAENVVAGVTTGVIAIAAVLWAAFFMMRNPKMLFSAAIATAVAVVTWVALSAV